MRHRTTDTPKGHRNYIIIACDVLLFLAMLKWLPVEPEVARGLAVLTFIGILWLTEALHVTVTSLLVPVLAMLMGILPGAKALSGFADPTIFLFFGGFALAGALHEQKIDNLAGGKNPPNGPRESGDGSDSDFPGYGVSFHVDVQYGHGGDDASSGDRPSGPHPGGKT